MKEVFTKRFWQSVKKTYYEALESPPPEDGVSQAPAEGNLTPHQRQKLRRHHLRASSTELSPDQPLGRRELSLSRYPASGLQSTSGATRGVSGLRAPSAIGCLQLIPICRARAALVSPRFCRNSIPRQG